MITLVVHAASDENRGEKPSRLKFKSFEEAAAHAVTVILPEIINGLHGLVGDAHAEAQEDADELKDLSEDLLSGDESKVKAAVEQWAEMADEGDAEFWVEWLD